MTNKVIILIVTLLCLCSCGGVKTPVKTISPPNPLITEEDFREAVLQYLKNGGGPAVSTYDIVLADLNGDHQPEGLVMMNTPFSTWCHLAGCTLLIFETHQGKVTLNSRIEPIRGPLFIHKKRDHSWKTIVTRQDGINREARYIELTNTGNGYQALTLNAPDYYGSRPQSGESYFY